jgi:hypothetical protein
MAGSRVPSRPANTVAMTVTHTGGAGGERVGGGAGSTGRRAAGGPPAATLADRQSALPPSRARHARRPPEPRGRTTSRGRHEQSAAIVRHTHRTGSRACRRSGARKRPSTVPARHDAGSPPGSARRGTSAGSRESGQLEQQVTDKDHNDDPEALLEDLFEVGRQLLAIRTMATHSAETYRGPRCGSRRRSLDRTERRRQASASVSQDQSQGIRTVRRSRNGAQRSAELPVSYLPRALVAFRKIRYSLDHDSQPP